MTTEILDAKTSQVAAYIPFYGELAKLEADNAALLFNYESPKGNKEARSHVFSLRKTKGALERVRKEAKAEYLRLGRAVDSEASEIEARIEAMISVHQTQIDAIEQREKDRVSALQKRLDAISPGIEQYASSDAVREAIAGVEAIEITADWQEFMAQAATLKASVLERLNGYLETAVKTEQEAAELARLRAEAEARAKADHEAAIAKAAAEKAQREAEEKAAAEKAKVQAALHAAWEEAARKEAEAVKEAEQAKAESLRKEQAAALAIRQEREKAQQEKEAAARREAELKLAAEMAEKRRQQEAAEAERQRVAAIQRAEEEKQRAIKAEQDRVAAEAKRIADEAAARERNKAHKAKINREALESLVAGGLTEEQAKLAVTLIAQGKVANVRIEY